MLNYTLKKSDKNYGGVICGGATEDPEKKNENSVTAIYLSAFRRENWKNFEKYSNYSQKCTQMLSENNYPLMCKTIKYVEKF